MILQPVVMSNTYKEQTKKYVKSIALALILLGSLPKVSSAQEVITLQEALKQALENNLQVKEAAFQESLTEQDVRQSKFNLLPNVSGSMNGSRGYGLFFDQVAGRRVNTAITQAGASVSANLIVFQGFSRINEIRRNKYQLMSDQTNVERVKNDLVLAVVTKYLEVITNQDLLTAANQQVKLSKEQLAAEDAGFEVGNRTLADLSQVKSQVATDELSVTTAQNNYDIALLDLKQLMEMDPVTDIQLEKPPLPDVDQIVMTFQPQEIFSEALRNYPDIKQAELNTMVAEKNISVLKGAFYPTLSFLGDVRTNYSSTAFDFQTGLLLPFWDQLRNNNFQLIGFNLSIPIFNNYQQTINLKKAKISYLNSTNAERLAKNNLNKVINQAVVDLRAAQARYYSTEENFQSSKDAFDAISQRYEVGLANSVELSTQQTAMNRAEFEFIQAKYDIIFRSKVIDFYLGKSLTLN